MDKKYIIGSGLTIAVLSVMLIFGSPMFNGIISNEMSVSESPTWTGTVCPTIERLDGSIEELECTTNLLTNLGANFTAETISGQDITGAAPGTDYAEHISLTLDAGGADATWLVLPTEIAAGGLERATGTLSTNSQGNYSCWKQFTASATHTAVHTAGINWNVTSAANSLVAANDLSSTVNLESGDKLTMEIFSREYFCL